MQGVLMILCKSKEDMRKIKEYIFSVDFFCGFVYNESMKSKENIMSITLIGMPSCGKTTVGKIISQMTGRSFLDTDEIISEKYGDISSIFEKYGEDEFRRMETEAVKETSKNCGTVISTGGGAILKEENIEALKSNGTVFFIDRPLEKLIPTKDRPLSLDRASVIKRYEERYEIYKKTADVIIDADATPEDVAGKIMSYME